MNDEILSVLCSIDQKLSSASPKSAGKGSNVGGEQSVKTSIKSINRVGTDEMIFVHSNPTRTGIWICNHSENNLYLKPSSQDMGESVFSTILKSKQTLFLDVQNVHDLYKGEIKGFWDGTADGDQAMITEFYLIS
jgi:hypothetical protein